MARKSPLVQIRLLNRRLRNTKPIVVLPLLTLLVLIVNAFDEWYSQVPVVLLCVIGLSYPRWLRSTRFWCIATAVFAAGIMMNWSTCDNHKYLICYWCLALCVVFEMPKPVQDSTLAHNGRLLIGICMLLAVFWRSISDCFLDGSFFHYTLLVDPRFSDFAQWFANASPMSLAENRELRQIMTEGYLHGVEVNRVALAGTAGMSLWSSALTWWTILVEASIGVLFLWPDSRRVAVVRNCLLLFFGVTTYAFATVRGFGWMLMLLGLAQCTDRDKGFRTAYLVAFLLIQAYLLPFEPIVTKLVSIFR